MDHKRRLSGNNPVAVVEDRLANPGSVEERAVGAVLIVDAAHILLTFQDEMYSGDLPVMGDGKIRPPGAPHLDAPTRPH
jgi:hypothetical protein